MYMYSYIVKKLKIYRKHRFKGNKKHGLGRYICRTVGYIILKSRITGTLPSFNKIQKTSLEYINAEKKLATTRGKLGEHLLKWEHIN